MSDPAGRAATPSIVARVFAHGGIYGLEYVMQTLVTMLLLPVYARYLGTSGYGKIGVLLSFSGVLSILMLQGLGSAWFRLRILPEVRDRLREFQTTIVLYLAASVTVVAGLFFLLGPLISERLTPNLPFYPWWPWVLVIAASTAFSNLFKLAARSEQKPLQYIVFTVLHQASTVAAVLVMVIALRAGALGQIQGTAFAAVPFAVLSLFLLRPYRRSENPRGDLGLAFAFGLPVLPHMLAGPLNIFIDRSVVNFFLGSSLAGVYIAGQQISRLTQAVAQALNMSYGPIFNNLAQEAVAHPSDSPEYRDQLKQIGELGHIITLTMLAVGTGVIVFSREVLLLLTNPEFAEAWRIIGLLVAAQMMMSYYFVFGRAVFFSRESVRYMPLLSWSFLLLNLAGNCILIPLMGILGAALSTLISQTMLALLTLRLANRFIRIPYPARMMLMCFAAFLLTAGALTWCDATLTSIPFRLLCKVGVALPFLLFTGYALLGHVRQRSAA